MSHQRRPTDNAGEQPCPPNPRERVHHRVGGEDTRRAQMRVEGVPQLGTEGVQREEELSVEEHRTRVQHQTDAVEAERLDRIGEVAIDAQLRDTHVGVDGEAGGGVMKELGV